MTTYADKFVDLYNSAKGSQTMVNTIIDVTSNPEGTVLETTFGNPAISKVKFTDGSVASVCSNLAEVVI